MSLIRRFLFWTTSIRWKLILVNGIVIAVVIWLAGVSVKDFACVIVGQYELAAGKSESFNSTMQLYLWRASIFAVLVASVVHYVFVSNILSPLTRLTRSTQMLISGQFPDSIPVKSKDEIGKLTAHFNELAKTLRRTEQNRKRLFSNISHELRTPLSNLNGYLEALTNGVIEGNPELYQSLLEESQHLTRLVEQLHHLTVWEARNPRSLAVSSIRIPELVRHTVQPFQLELDKKGVSLHLSLQDKELLGDEDGIRQIITNLVGNALAYNTGSAIWLTGKAERDEYRLTVINEGEAIPEDMRELVFERFFRVDPSRHREKDKYGTGLGLAIVKEIAEQHGGQAGLDTDGRKHSFWVELPVRKTPS